MTARSHAPINKGGPKVDIDRAAVPDRGDEATSRVSSSGLWWGGLLIAGGALWLADATGVFSVSPWMVAAFFALAGVGFAFDAVRDPHNWWAAIPGGALIGLGALIAFVEGTTAPDVWGAAILLACTGLGFLAVYLRAREHWWALVPAGVLLSVAIIVASVPIVDTGEDIAVVVLGLMAAILVGLALVPIRGRRMWWPLVPAGILAVVAAFLARDAAEVLEPFNWVVPAAVLLIGLFVTLRALSGPGASR
jgi:hypothetical protein